MFRFRTYRPDRVLDMLQIEQIRAIIKRSRELLASSPTPDTFAGRKTQEPFPVEDEGHMARWMVSKELKPRE
jgi:hypothetical protein